MRGERRERRDIIIKSKLYQNQVNELKGSPSNQNSLQYIKNIQMVTMGLDDVKE